MTELATIQEPSDFEKGSDLLAEAASFKIKDNTDYASAGQRLMEIKAFRRKIEEFFEEPCRKAYEAWKSMTKRRDSVLDPVELAEDVYGHKIGAYDMEIQQKRQIEQEKAEEKARAKAEEERKKKIELAKKHGDKEAARELAQAPLVVQPPVEAKTPDTPKVEGMNVRMMWDFKVDEATLDRKFMKPDLERIRKVVNALGDKAAIPGVKVFQKPVVSGRTQ